MPDAWEDLRSIVFTGQRRPQDTPPVSQEELVRIYESQLERNPLTEWKLFREASRPVLSQYIKEQEAIRRMERLMSEGDDPLHHQDLEEEDWMEQLHDEISNLETEQEWQDWKKKYTGL